MAQTETARKQRRMRLPQQQGRVAGGGRTATSNPRASSESGNFGRARGHVLGGIVMLEGKEGIVMLEGKEGIVMLEGKSGRGTD